MSNDKTIGAIMALGSIAGIAIYFWLLFVSEWCMLTVKVSAFLAVAAVLLIVAWIGYTLYTTPPPMPFEDLDFDNQEE